jgi:hypothetical protein
MRALNSSPTAPCVRLTPTGLKAFVHSGSHKEVSRVYFSTVERLEPVNLTQDSIMQRAGLPMLNDSASNPRLPCLYICPEANVLGRAPLIQCFISGKSHPIIPYRFKDDWCIGPIGHASTDTQRAGTGATALGQPLLSLLASLICLVYISQ